MLAVLCNQITQSILPLIVATLSTCCCTHLQVVARLEALEASGGFAEIVVVGGGYAGVELAAVVAERLQGRGRIKLVTSTPDILDSSPQVRALVWGCSGCVQWGAW